jgi:adenine phosphoribosyltransferase
MRRIGRAIVENAGVLSAGDRARQALLDRFAWNGGHANVWRVFDDGAAFGAVVAGLVEPWQTSDDITKVCGIESRGFLLGGAAALALGLGFVAIRKQNALFPGAKRQIETDTDYRGIRHVLQIQEASVGAGDRLLLVDDWIERGSQASAAQQLVESCGAVLEGIAVVVDQLDGARRSSLPPVSSIVTADQLPSL